MFKLERSGFGFWRKIRLVALEGVDATQFDEVARQIGSAARRAKKFGFVAARQAVTAETVETRWNGKETENTAQPGDFVVTALTEGREVLRDGAGHANVYVIRAQKFPELYDVARELRHASKAAREAGDIYRPKGVVDALRLTGGFEIKAPWGEVQSAPSGYLLRNGLEVYGNNRETFEASYRFID